jgi:hypothetical protein
MTAGILLTTQAVENGPYMRNLKGGGLSANLYLVS